jgi:hypothetical protein
MRLGTASLFTLSLAGAAALAGCLFGQGASPQTVVQTRASNELSCAKDKLQIQPLGGTSYKATGCGMTATYTCMGGNAGNPYDAMCTREGNATPVGGVADSQAK